MTQKHFIALADAIRAHKNWGEHAHPFAGDQLNTLADFCESQNPKFNRERWMSYVQGYCGPNGGSVAVAEE